MTAFRGFLLLFWVVFTACSQSVASTETTTDEAHGTLAVYRGQLTPRMLLTGELVAEDSEQLVAPNVNIWPLSVRWLAEDGVEVRQGEPVVELDNTQLVANIDEERTRMIEAATRLDSLIAQVAAEESSLGFELEQRKAEVAKARLEADVPQEAFAARTYQRLQLDLRKAELALAEAEAKLAATRRVKQAEVEIQRIALEQARLDVTRSQSRLGLLTLRAARDGILILETNRREDRPYQVGDTIFPGQDVARLPDLGTLIVEARLFDVDDGRIAVGMPVEATLDAFQDRVFSGEIREIDQIADPASSRSLRRFFRVRIDLEEVDPELMRPGMSAKVVIDQSSDEALLAPRASLDWTDGGPRALLADGSWVAVELGACDVRACVVESGLAEATALGRVGDLELAG